MSTGKPLFLAVCIIAFITFSFVSDIRSTWFTQLIEKRYAANLCSRGWSEVKCMVVSVVVGFL